MKMNTVLVAAVLAASVAVAKEAVWKSDGSGGWGSSNRWVNGNVPDPDGGETWTVKINDGDTAVVTDADKRYFECITSLSVGENAKLVVTNDSPITFNFPMSGKGKVEIYGSGVVTQRYEESYYQYNNTGGWEIFDGVLAVYCPLSLSSSTVVQFRCPYGVWSPGVIEPDPTYSVQFRGLYGDGTVRDPTGGGIATITFASLSSPSAPCDFSGNFANFGSSFYITVNGARQIISNPATAAALNSPRFFNSGSLGLAAFPSTVNMRSGNSEVEFMGAGGTVGGEISLTHSGYAATLNAGPSGGTTFTTTFSCLSKMNVLTLTGTNAVAAVFSGTFPFEDGDVAAYLKKTGTGTWRLTNTAKGNQGTVAVEKGTLEYETIAERGTACSLGKATITHSEYTGNRDDTKVVPYACIIGDGTDVADESVATLKYVGSTAATVTNRAVVVSGTGRFASDNAALDWTGFSSASNDGGTLILAGAANGCVARGVTDGQGPLSVVKDGDGTWTLADTIDFSGGVTVKKGTLKMKLGQYYTWFRYVVKSVYTATQPRVYLGHLAFFDEAGNDLSFGTTYDISARANNMTLKPGKCTLGSTSQIENTAADYPLANLFNTYVNGQYGRWSYSPTKAFDVNDDSTWLTLVVRLPFDAGQAVKYDMISGQNLANKPAQATPSTWVLYGSPDGINWAQIDSQSDFKKYRANENYWLSDQSAYSNDSPTGFAFSSTEAETSKYVKMSSVSSVSVSAGAKLVSDKVVPANAIEFDAGEGAGTIDGFSFPAEGVLELKGCGSALAGDVNIPLCFTNCTGLANIAGWTLSMEGKPVEPDKYEITASSSGIVVRHLVPGFIMIVY